MKKVKLRNIEKFKYVKGYYWLHEDGSIYSTYTQKFMNTKKDKYSNQEIVSLRIDSGNNPCFYINYLLAEAFTKEG